jgi:hypothetical protein
MLEWHIYTICAVGQSQMGHETPTATRLDFTQSTDERGRSREATPNPLRP